PPQEVAWGAWEPPVETARHRHRARRIGVVQDNQQQLISEPIPAYETARRFRQHGAAEKHPLRKIWEEPLSQKGDLFERGGHFRFVGDPGSAVRLVWLLGHDVKVQAVAVSLLDHKR